MGRVFHKNQCYICHKMFVPDFCKICNHKEYGLCHYCHNGTVSHIKALKGQLWHV